MILRAGDKKAKSWEVKGIYKVSSLADEKKDEKKVLKLNETEVKILKEENQERWKWGTLRIIPLLELSIVLKYLAVNQPAFHL